MLSCVIIDDEPLAQEILTGYIGQESLRLLGCFYNAFDAQAFLKDHAVDVLFLDIEMPEMNGIDFLRSLTAPPITVFTTAFRDYAFEGFELGVIDFLLKPISLARFRVAVEKVRDFLALKREDAGLEAVSGAGRIAPEYVFVKSGVERIKLFFADVTHIQGLKDYAIIHVAGGPAGTAPAGKGKIVIKGSVKHMLSLFPAGAFIRVHKSFIVAKDKVRRIERNRILIGEHQIPIGRNYKEEVERRILG
ncbi:MAG TPA: LytTR family DNA-binding domain-containing protein [Puia sp.]|jgi:DNA-binding LytR/AlgR family response regulator|nr:LytTR family DNA-binding domain-containing protein [Puia sp.]